MIVPEPQTPLSKRLMEYPISSDLIGDLIMAAKDLECQLAEKTAKLNDLLAVIHRDGGHYLALNGLDNACRDAQNTVVKLFGNVDELVEKTAEAQRYREALEKARNRVYEMVNENIDGSYNLWYAINKALEQSK